jgi:hypothetical protein
VAEGPLRPVRFAVANGLAGADLRLETASADDVQAGKPTLRVNRVLRLGDGIDVHRDAGPPGLCATWRSPDGPHVRGAFATARYSPI